MRAEGNIVQQNATEESGLSPQQLQALESLLRGETVTEAASRAGVDRTTVHRWQREDYRFMAAVNSGRREIAEAIQARLLGVALSASETVASAIESGDVRTALTVLKGMGVLSGELPRIGPEDPEEIRNDAAIAAGEAKQNLMFQKMLAGL